MRFSHDGAARRCRVNAGYSRVLTIAASQRRLQLAYSRTAPSLLVGHGHAGQAGREISESSRQVGTPGPATRFRCQLAQPYSVRLTFRLFVRTDPCRTLELTTSRIPSRLRLSFSLCPPSPADGIASSTPCSRTSRMPNTSARECGATPLYSSPFAAMLHRQAWRGSRERQKDP
jgi:hypothetical protein